MGKNKGKASSSNSGQKKGVLSVHVRHILCEKQSKLLQAQSRVNSGEDFGSVGFIGLALIFIGYLLIGLIGC